jgi:Zn2+/Cd2+-exporting ATPase
VTAAGQETSHGVACPGCEGERTDTFVVEGMCCGVESALVEERLRGLAGVCSVQASPVTGRATVVHTIDAQAVRQAIEDAGFQVRALQAPSAPVLDTRTTLAALALTAAGFLAGWYSRSLAVAFYLPAILIGGHRVARKGLERARQGTLDMNALMTVAVLGAMAIGEWGEGASTVVLFSLAQLLEARSLERARRAIGGLMDLAPETARVRRGDEEARVPVAAVRRGEVVVVGPGERVPLDGVVEAGSSEVDQSPLTGESHRVPKAPGDGVFAGSINGPGALTVSVTRAAAETTLARLLRRVEEAQSSRAAAQGFVESFARVYTPAVLVLAVLVAVVPPLLGLGTVEAWTYRALVLLVISCPCALVISTPVSIVSALTAASRVGVLIKGGAHLEELGKVRAVLFDKTGTLTRGEPEVTDVLAAPGYEPGAVLAAAAAVEARSGHLLGEALVERARRDGVAVATATEVNAIPGRGVQGRVGDRLVLVGSHRLFDERGLCDHRLDADLQRLEEDGKTAVLVGVEGEPRALLGVVGMGDKVRDEAPAALAELGALGVEVAMLTGDNARTARALAQQLGIADHQADLLPEAKVEHVRAARRRVGTVAMVGDGVNDAPGLATANVGIAMGRRGTDVALETADVALMGDDLRRIPATIRLGRATRRVIRQNIALSLGVKALVLGLALAGYGTLWAAVAADMGASLLVIGNGLRLLRTPLAPAGDS